MANEGDLLWCKGCERILMRSICGRLPDCPECGANPAPLALVATYNGVVHTQAAQLDALTLQIVGE
jgi:hypothetical protein